MREKRRHGMKCKRNGECNVVRSPVIPRSADEQREAIRRVAQQNYEKRGRAPGHELDDWLKAEQIVKNTASC